MAFFDKLSDIAKNLGEKASEVVESTKQKATEVMESGKLNAKIKTEQENIDEMHRQIGAYYENKHTGQTETDPELQKLLDAVEKSRTAIAEYDQELAKIKEEEEAREAQRNAPATPEAQPDQPAQTETTEQHEAAADAAQEAQQITCPVCGAKNDPGSKFCTQCGIKLEDDMAEKTQP